MGNPFSKWLPKDTKKKTEPQQPVAVPPYTPKNQKPAALQGTTGGMPNPQAWIPGYKSTYDLAKPVGQAMNATTQAVRNLFGANGQQMTPDNYRNQVLTGNAYGAQPQNTGIVQEDANGNLNWMRQLTPGLTAWQKALDYPDAAARDQNRQAINSFSGIPRFIGQGISKVQSAADMLKLNTPLKFPPFQGPPAPESLPLDTGTQMASTGTGGGGGAGGGYGGYGGGGGYGGYSKNMPPWYYGLSTWRI